jgi:hypothetical protein
MKKKLLTIATVVAMVGTVLVGCGTPTAGVMLPKVNEGEAAVVQEAEVATVESEDVADEANDIELARKVVEDFFAENFADCTMNSLEYDDSYTAEQYADIAASYGADEAVIFTSSFSVPQDCQNMTLNAGMTYEDYTYTLTRTAGGDWVIQNCGMQ